MKPLITKWRWWYGALPLLFALAGCGANGEPAKPEEEHSSDGEAHVTVRTELARLGTFTESIEGLGRCEALPDHIATLTPAVEGHVHELLVAARHCGEERTADRRARPGGRAGRSRGEDREQGRAQSLSGSPQGHPPRRGAAG